MEFDDIVGIDTGTSETGICRIAFRPDQCLQPNIKYAELIPNSRVIPYIESLRREGVRFHAVVEGFQSNGNVWGLDMIQAVYFTGRLLGYLQDSGIKTSLFPRRTYAAWVTGSKFNDASIKVSLEATYGSMKKGGPLASLAGRRSDIRSAFSLAKYYEFRCMRQAAGDTNLAAELVAFAEEVNE